MSASRQQKEQIRKTLTALWERSRPVVDERVAELDRAAEAAAAGSMTAQDRLSAAATAHKLAGSVGMFGYRQAGELARSIEHLLTGDDPVDALALRELTDLLRAALNP